jgi:hypothetical protein
MMMAAQDRVRALCFAPVSTDNGVLLSGRSNE